MPGGKPIIYWDTSVLLAWIKNEQRPNDEMEGVYEVAQEIHKNHCTLLTSVVTQTEVLESMMDESAKQKFLDLFKRRNCQMVGTDRRISLIASELRSYYQKAVDGLPTLGTPDALHLATAIHFGVKEFHTFDERDEPRKRRGLIPLNGIVAGKYPLVICKPPPPAQFPLIPRT